jgi:hypothetical protein
MLKSKPTSIADSLFDFKKVLAKRQKYIKNDFQAIGLQIAEELNDWKHKALYIRLAKTSDPKILEAARNFIKDQSPHTIKSKARLFMWKLKQLRNGI